MAGKTHVSQVQNEAVAIVEAVPGHRHLSGTDCTASFDLEEPLYHHLIGYHVLESRCHASFLSGQGDSVSPVRWRWSWPKTDVRKILTSGCSANPGLSL